MRIEQIRLKNFKAFQNVTVKGLQAFEVAPADWTGWRRSYAILAIGYAAILVCDAITGSYPASGGGVS